MVLLFFFFWVLTLADNSSDIATTLQPLSSLNFLNFENQAVEIVVAALLLIGIVSTNIALSSQIILTTQSIFFRALLYIVICSIGGIYALPPTLPAAICLSAALYRIVKTYNLERDTAAHFFEAAFLIGVGTLFYSPLLTLGVIVFVGMYQTYSIDLRKIVVVLVGMATPFVFAVAINYLLDRDIASLFAAFSIELPSSVFHNLTLFSKVVHIAIGVITLLIILFSLQKIKYRNKAYSFYSSLMIWVLSICIALFLSVSAVGDEIIFLAAIPICFFLEQFLIETKHHIAADILFIFLLLSPFISTF